METKEIFLPEYSVRILKFLTTTITTRKSLPKLVIDQRKNKGTLIPIPLDNRNFFF